jgi:hypothetical protein
MQAIFVAHESALPTITQCPARENMLSAAGWELPSEVYRKRSLDRSLKAFVRARLIVLQTACDIELNCPLAQP